MDLQKFLNVKFTISEIQDIIRENYNKILQNQKEFKEKNPDAKADLIKFEYSKMVFLELETKFNNIAVEKMKEDSNHE